RAAADGALDAMPHHEVEPARGCADDRLPAFDGSIDGAWHQRDLAQGVAAVGNRWGQLVMLAAMGKRLRIERFEDDLYLLLKQFAVGMGVLHGSAKGLNFARVIAAADAEDGAPLGEDVGDGKVLGEPQRMPHGSYVEAAADAQPARDLRQ